MKNFNYKKLLSNMCCSDCRGDFDENSVSLVREEKNLLILNLKCQNCGKDFGLIFLGFDSEKDGDDSLKFLPTPLPVDYNEVLDAHEFIDKLEKDWTKYIPEDFK